MNFSKIPLEAQNPFTYPSVWGRRKELLAIYRNLLGSQTYSCALIGEESFGKTTLLRYLAEVHNSLTEDSIDMRKKFMFVYFDCISYKALAKQNNVSSQFWWDLYKATLEVIQPGTSPDVSEPEWNTESEQVSDAIDETFEVKKALKELIQKSVSPVVLLLDNFEGVASLHLRDSEWLRALTQDNCRYIVASRYQLYLVYHIENSAYDEESTMKASPLWNIFSDPIYIGLMEEHEVEDFLINAKSLAKKNGSTWKQDDIDFVRRLVGRHPEFLRIACKHLFEQRLRAEQFNEQRMYAYLKFIVAKEVNAVCEHLWQGLRDQELAFELRIVKDIKEKTVQGFSLPQEILLSIAKEQQRSEESVLFSLEQRGLIEWESKQEKWQVFSEVMQRFVLEQGQLLNAETEDVKSKGASHPEDASEEELLKQFTPLEGLVYSYLSSHLNQVCNREELMHAIWNDSEYLRSNSALQKIIERLRDKLEADGMHSYSLIAVRGQGYMLRKR